MRVKICGLSTPETVDAAAQAGADWIGFVFVPASPRAVTPAQAARLAPRAAGGPRVVGLFVSPNDEDVAAALDAVALDALQVHAPLRRASTLRQRFGIPVWHAVGVAEPADLPAAADGVDALLLDAKPSPARKAEGLPGGNAEPFDWTIPRGWSAPLPWLLAGGLTPANVAAAIRSSGATAVDVSSGVELSRGVKNPALIRAFIRAARET